MMFILLFVKDTATTEIYTYLHTLSLHDALPIFVPSCRLAITAAHDRGNRRAPSAGDARRYCAAGANVARARDRCRRTGCCVTRSRRAYGEKQKARRSGPLVRR